MGSLVGCESTSYCSCTCGSPSAATGGVADSHSQNLHAAGAVTAVATANRPRSSLKAFAEVRQDWLVKLRITPTRSRRAAPPPSASAAPEPAA
ncbi:hypothetical protein CHLRE_13g588626v5 [Chlamydomonas reinhardtii]|uniref:Uncharacterized protein n=1 Tax=Chlamydomonas reinhardtii TaxID=3055 RepID=A0A2K3D0W8_CHLRE|nr:uncharacterized protein CHLRE_13g588626v5 [Chlamydomonas reinhardtii]PNW74185.1 hypothetical protein CHLRE_13g588626v5 [Chlamydomonas reinhardtii]